ncbi:tyrosine-type recombinase/integrase [Herbidospora daliensis]|uniref:tyrosine-type recombinase/integrase n=1 Tax=Herbidospora daliensis TaxID=295585 RepID=UPI0007804902|nr:site-specific integrase [Herbidospora daliensis]
MAYVKDLWNKTVRHPDGRTRRVKTARHGAGKRWLAVWLDPNGKEASRAFAKKTDAEKHASSMEADVGRGDYIDPNAGKVLFADVAKRWMDSRIVDPATKIRYEYIYRLHVAPTFDKRQVKSILPSHIQGWISDLNERYGPSTIETSFLVLQGVLELAVADEAIKKNPARSSIVQVPRRSGGELTAWADERVHGIIHAHQEFFRLVPIIAASCGLRQGEVFGLALEDIDFEGRVLQIRRQIKKLGSEHVFALPKNDRERVVPLPEWTAEAIRRHVAAFPPLTCSLPWEKLNGKVRTHNLLVQWTDDRFIRARVYSELIWKPALVAAGVIPAPTKDANSRTRFATSRKEGLHQLRHYYASVMLAGAVSVKELAEYLGHADPGFTLRVYAHLMPGSHDRARKAIDDRLFRPRLISHGTGTEQ